MDDRQLIADLLSALEYHTEQTRPIEFSKVAIEAARQHLRKPAQQMNPEIKKMYEDYFDKFFRESSSAVPENFMDALRFDVAVRDARDWEKVDMREHAEGNLGIGTAPPPQRKPLTKEEMFEAIRPLYSSEKNARIVVDICEDEYRAIEAAHGIKE